MRQSFLSRRRLVQGLAGLFVIGLVGCENASPPSTRLSTTSNLQSLHDIFSASDTPIPSSAQKQGETQAIYRGHRSMVWTVAWSPDGTTLASASMDGTVQVWTALGRPIYTYHGTSTPLFAVAWSPDGLDIASGGGDVRGGTNSPVRIWNALTGEPSLLYQSDSHQNLAIWSITWSPRTTQPPRIASASMDHTVQVWNAATGNHLFTYRGHADDVYTAEWSPDGTLIASAGGNHMNAMDYRVLVWESASGKTHLIYKGHAGTVAAVSWSPDGKYIASASMDGTVHVWNARTGQLYYAYRGHLGGVWRVAWSPNGRYLASAGIDRTVQIWDAGTGNTLYIYRQHTDEVWAAAWSPDSTKIASSSADNTIRVWRAV